MKEWQLLTEAGQIRRLRSLAGAAIDHFPIHPTRVRLVGGFTNVIFRIDTTNGPYALRVDLHQDHTDTDVEIELAWLNALSFGTDLRVARPVKAVDGRSQVYAETEGVPGARRCVLFEWIKGRTLADSPSEARYEALGRLSAGLHRHGATYQPPRRPMAWDRVFYWPDGIDPVVIFSPEMAHHFTNGRMKTLERAITQVETAFAGLDSHSAHIVHGDLHPWNAHAVGNRVTALDFEDVMWAHPVQDVAITLFYLRDEPRDLDFAAAFEAGYRSIAKWPASYEGELQHFMAARTLMFINYIANLQEDPSDFYARAFPRLEGFLSDFG